jgi:primosomal replication protein N
VVPSAVEDRALTRRSVLWSASLVADPSRRAWCALPASIAGNQRDQPTAASIATRSSIDGVREADARGR